MSESETEVPQPEFEKMSADDWVEYLQRWYERCLVINAPNGVHTVEYDVEAEEVTFYANGSRGYDADGTRAVLEDVAHSDGTGLQVQTKVETYE